MKSPKELIDELTDKLLKWAKEYYEGDNPSVSDAQYDGTYNTLIELEEKHPELRWSNSPTQQVGGQIDNRFKKVNHEFPMLSLSNAFNEDDLIKFDKQIKDLLHRQEDIEYVTEYKIDGLSIALKYVDGKFIQAVTRGDGTIGEDVTHNVKEIKSIPKQIDYKQPLEVRGEVFMSDKVFEELNRNGTKLANPRNAAAGSLRQLDSNVARERNLDGFLYQIPNPLDHNLTTHNSSLEFLSRNGLKVNKETKVHSNIQEVIQEVRNKMEKRNSLGYEVDGIVIKVNNINLYDDIGYTVKFPKFMIAYKFPEEVGETKLLDIFATVGRTGRITYNAKLEPVRLAGTTVSAATLHNADYIREINIEVGDLVKVKKAGEIIPKVIGPVESKQQPTNWRESEICPSCEHSLKRFEEEVDQYCINDECPDKQQAKIEHYVSRVAMNIEGVSSEIIRTFISRGYIKNIASLYDLKNHQEDLIALPGFKDKSVSKIISSIEKSKEMPLDKFIFGLGIRHTGAKYSKILANRFGTLERLMSAKIEELVSIRDLGPKVSKSIVEYFTNKKNIELIKSLSEKELNLKEAAKNSSNILKGNTFVITGTLSEPRGKFKSLIEDNGGNVSSAVSSRTDYLLSGENSGSKKDKAESLGVKIINEEELNEMIKEENNG